MQHTLSRLARFHHSVVKEDMMKNLPRTYVLTLNSPSRQALRLWTGRSMHTLRHCSVKQIERVLREMQEYIADLQSTRKAAVSERSYSLNRSR